MNEFVPRGANSFLSELTLIEKGGKTEDGRVASPERNMRLIISLLYISGPE